MVLGPGNSDLLSISYCQGLFEYLQSDDIFLGEKEKKKYRNLPVPKCFSHGLKVCLNLNGEIDLGGDGEIDFGFGLEDENDSAPTIQVPFVYFDYTWYLRYL